MSHGIVKCKECGKEISRCRCTCNDIHYSVCETCKRGADSIIEERDTLMHSLMNIFIMKDTDGETFSKVLNAEQDKLKDIIEEWKNKWRDYE
jgi:hypothetical protein